MFYNIIPETEKFIKKFISLILLKATKSRTTGTASAHSRQGRGEQAHRKDKI